MTPRAHAVALTVAVALGACALPLAPAAHAQTGSIAGTVVDATTRRPIEGALVQITGTSLGTFSLASGAFTIFAVPPGEYTVSARRFGYAAREVSRVAVQIARRRTLTIALRASLTDSIDRDELPPPAGEQGIGATSISLDSEQLVSQPTSNVAGALAATGGYLELPRSAAVLSLSDLRRGIVRLASVRAARAEATQYLLDGIAVSSPLFGTPPLMLEPYGAANVMLAPGHADAEYGGMLSGVVSQAIREGGARTEAAFDYQSTLLAGKLGSPTAAASGTYALRGFVSGPMPLSDGALRMSLSGHLLGERADVTRASGGDWRGSGDNVNKQLTAKLSYTMSPTVRFSLATLGQRRRVNDIEPGVLTGDSVAPAIVRDDARFIVGRAEKRFARATVSLSLATNGTARETCNMWQGVCVRDRIARVPFGYEVPIYMPPRLTPYAASGQFYALEDSRTNSARGDVAVAVGSHHQIGAGVYAARHAFNYTDVTAYRWLQGVVLTSTDTYRARPVEFATYVQDAMQFDLITVHLGMRFDYANTGGYAFTNPLNPTNGTTAREVCDGTAPGLSETPYTYGQFRGLAACFNAPRDDNGRSVLLDSATRVAQRDDMHRVRPRAAFAPRIGLSFPLTETSGLYLNVGRFSKQPEYHHAFRNTGIGSIAGPSPRGDGMCGDAYVRPGSNECRATFQLDTLLPEFVGNPDLSFQLANSFEVGFSSLAGPAHTLDVSLFNNAQLYLPSVYSVAIPPDFGATYGVSARGLPRTVQNRGSMETMGVSVTLRRRTVGPVSYTMNYVWQRSAERGVPPDFVAEMSSTGTDVNNTAEYLSARSRTHTLNAVVSWQWRQAMAGRYGRAIEALLRNSRTVVTVSSGSRGQLPSAADTVCSSSSACPAVSGGISATGHLVNVFYAKALSVTGPQWAFIVRVRNLLDADDGSAQTARYAARRARSVAGSFAPREPQVISLRRVLTGISVRF